MIGYTFSGGVILGNDHNEDNKSKKGGTKDRDCVTSALSPLVFPNPSVSLAAHITSDRANSRLFVSNALNHQVLVLSPDGTILDVVRMSLFMGLTIVRFCIVPVQSSRSVGSTPPESMVFPF